MVVVKSSTDLPQDTRGGATHPARRIGEGGDKYQVP
jgi:hypothetical protein